MITYYTLITILLCHWIFDFFLQTDEMAKNKSHSNLALLEHVWVYSYGVSLLALLNYKYIGNWLVVFVIVNGVAHFLTDYVTSRASSGLYKDNRIHDFFVVIGGDQMIHYITLFGTFIWLSNL